MKRICTTAAGYGDEVCIEIDDRIKTLMEGAQEDVLWTRGVIPLRGMEAFDDWRERKDVPGSRNTGLRDAQVTYW